MNTHVRARIPRQKSRARGRTRVGAYIRVTLTHCTQMFDLADMGRSCSTHKKNYGEAQTYRACSLRGSVAIPSPGRKEARKEAVILSCAERAILLSRGHRYCTNADHPRKIRGKQNVPKTSSLSGQDIHKHAHARHRTAPVTVRKKNSTSNDSTLSASIRVGSKPCSS